METHLLSIVIVNFNAGEYLEKCLLSVEKQTFRDFEVIVVDNASKDSSLSAAKSRPWIRTIESKTNLGFAGGQNLGMRAASGRYRMPLNFDIHLSPDYLEVVVEALAQNPRVGSVSGKMLRMLPDGRWTDELDNAGLLLPPRRFPIHRGGGEQDRGQYDQCTLVFGAMGAAAVYRQDMLEDIALNDQYFDESFFTWYEDIDLEWRGRLRGWECLYVPNAVAYHVGDPQKNMLTAFSARHSIRNRWQMVLTNECPHCVRQNWRPLLLEEIHLLRHVILKQRISAYLRAVGEVFMRLPALREKRRRVRSTVIRSCLPEYPQQFIKGENV